jgi:hypothetical protein
MWGCAKKSNIDIIQQYHNKVLGCSVNAPWYAHNRDIQRELGEETVASIIARCAIAHENCLQHCVNEEVSRLLNVKNLIRQPFELVKRFDNSWRQWENLAQHLVNSLALN